MNEPAKLPAKRILLVDDSKSARFALRNLLQKRGFTVELSESAETALEMIHKAPPDAVFMDHLMPGMDGHAATVALKSDPATAHIPIVMCTSNDRPEHVQKAKELGALGVLPKPATPEKLTEVLAALDREPETSAPSMDPVTPISSARTQELEATLRAMLPPLIEETLAPLIERMVTEHGQTIRSQGSVADAAQIEAAVAQELDAGKGDWLREVADSVERQVITESVSAEQRLKKTLLEHLAVTARENQGELVERILADDRLRASLNAAATTSAEQVAAAVAQQQAQEVSQNTVETLVPTLVSDSLAAAERQTEALRRRMGWLAAATVVVGLIGSVAVYLLVTA